MDKPTVEERLARLEQFITIDADGRCEVRCHRVVVVDIDGYERIIGKVDFDPDEGRDMATFELLTARDHDDFESCNYVRLYTGHPGSETPEIAVETGVTGWLHGDNSFTLDGSTDHAGDTDTTMWVGRNKLGQYREDHLAYCMEQFEKSTDYKSQKRWLELIGEAVERQAMKADLLEMSRLDGERRYEEQQAAKAV